MTKHPVSVSDSRPVWEAEPQPLSPVQKWLFNCIDEFVCAGDRLYLLYLLARNAIEAAAHRLIERFTKD